MCESYEILKFTFHKMNVLYEMHMIISSLKLDYSKGFRLSLSVKTIDKLGTLLFFFFLLSGYIYISFVWGNPFNNGGELHVCTMQYVTCSYKFLTCKVLLEREKTWE